MDFSTWVPWLGFREGGGAWINCLPAWVMPHRGVANLLSCAWRDALGAHPILVGSNSILREQTNLSDRSQIGVMAPASLFRWHQSRLNWWQIAISDLRPAAKLLPNYCPGRPCVWEFKYFSAAPGSTLQTSFNCSPQIYSQPDPWACSPLLTCKKIRNFICISYILNVSSIDHETQAELQNMV